LRVPSEEHAPVYKISHDGECAPIAQFTEVNPFTRMQSRIISIQCSNSSNQTGFWRRSSVYRHGWRRADRARNPGQRPDHRLHAERKHQPDQRSYGRRCQLIQSFGHSNPSLFGRTGNDLIQVSNANGVVPSGLFRRRRPTRTPRRRKFRGPPCCAAMDNDELTGAAATKYRRRRWQYVHHRRRGDEFLNGGAGQRTSYRQGVNGLRQRGARQRPPLGRHRQ